MLFRPVGFLALAAALSGATGWLFASTFTSIAETQTPEYLLVLRPLWHLAVWCLAALIAIGATQRFLVPRFFRLSRWQDAFAWRYVAPLTPVLLLLLPLASMAMLATPLRAIAPPWLHLFIDLRWWLILVIVALTTYRYMNVSGRGLGVATAWMTRAGRHPHSSLWDLALILALLVLSFVAGPQHRFDSGVLGDEPKYLRYLENWYRGRGMDITNLVPIDQLPVDAQPDFGGNLRHAAAATALVATDLVNDGRRLLGLDAPPPPPPAFSNGGAFVEGRRGGVYQVHNPGLSLLLLPGYVVDRYLLNWTSPAGSQFPTHLYATHLSLLALYLLWGVALFKLLQSHTQDVATSWVVACVAMLSLPASAFAYQYYPEVAGGLFFAAVIGYAVLSTDTRLLPAFGYGLLAGYLPWIHVRFGSAAVLAAAAVLVTRGRAGLKTAIVFGVGLAIPMTALCLYSYHITGSLLPFKVWTLLKDELQVFTPGSFPRRLAGLWLDIDWGVVAHAPIYLLAVAGLWPMWRRSWRTAILVLLFMLALAIPAAGHNWSGSGTTPLRLIAAVVPLVALPLAAAVIHFKRSRWFLVLFSVLTVISLQNAFTFNVNFNRAWPALRGPNLSGWLSRLAMPNMDVGEPIKNPFVLAWVALTVLLFLWPMRRQRASAGSAAPSWTFATAIVLLAVATASSAAAALTGISSRSRFIVERPEARDAVMSAALPHRGNSVWSADRGTVPIERLFPNPETVDVRVDLDTHLAMLGAEVPVKIAASGPNGEQGWGVASVDFGDGRPPQRTSFVGSTTMRSEYPKAGEYQMSVTVATPGAGQTTKSERVTVVAEPLIDPYGVSWIAGLPRDAMKHPVSVAIDRISLSDSSIAVHGKASGLGNLSTAEIWVWLIGYEGDNLKAHLYRPERGAGSATDSGSFTLTIAPTLLPNAGKTSSVLVGISPGQGTPVNARSRLFSFNWPSPQLTAGSPIVMSASESR